MGFYHFSSVVHSRIGKCQHWTVRNKSERAKIVNETQTAAQQRLCAEMKIAEKYVILHAPCGQSVIRALLAINCCFEWTFSNMRNNFGWKFAFNLNGTEMHLSHFGKTIMNKIKYEVFPNKCTAYALRASHVAERLEKKRKKKWIWIGVAWRGVAWRWNCSLDVGCVRVAPTTCCRKVYPIIMVTRYGFLVRHWCEFPSDETEKRAITNEYFHYYYFTIFLR